MAIKVSALTRKLAFALVMSASTALITTAIVIYMQAKPQAWLFANFLTVWLKAFITVWPIVFMVILLIAPLVNALLDILFQESK